MFRTPPHHWFHQSAKNHETDWRICYHGTAGFTVSSQQTTIVLDPFVTRPSLLSTAFRRLRANPAAVAKHFPRADAVLVGHAHHDHVLDAPQVCMHTGGQFVGAPDAANVARAAGLPESQITETRGKEDLDFGAATIRGIPSRHGRVYFGQVTLPGNIDTPPTWPTRVWQLRHGTVLNWHVSLGGIRVVHIDSADVIDDELEGLQADVVCLCAIGRRYRPNYVQTVIEKLKPRWVIPCHWDWFFTPYDAPPRLLPGVDLPGFLDEIRENGAEPILLPFGGQLTLSESVSAK
jgi:L-ascorbate metabolism protein UlaG (beta-lactamase superfamily)